MRDITRKELKEIKNYSEPISEETILDHYVLDEFECSECGEDIVLRQWGKSHDAGVQCLNPECDNEAIMR